MGFRLLIDGQDYEASQFNVQEAATPLAAGDSSGAVGTVSFNTPRPDPDVRPNHPINKWGVNYLIDKHVQLDDTRKGFTLGRVQSVQQSLDSAEIQVTALSRLGELNVYNVQAQPFIGTLGNAFAYYLSLANITYDFSADQTIATRPVVFPGWSGELWFYLKQLAAAVDCDVSLVSGIILLRPVRARTATRGRDLSRTQSIGGGTLAQFVEVYQYNNTPITNKLVYPPGGWSEEVTTINVNSGETIEEVLELSASVSSISQPVMQTFVSRGHDSSSVFTVVGDDGLPIQPSAWEARGGSLSVEINPDTTSLTVKITAPTGLPNKDGAEIGVYGISLSSDNSTGRYSTLRIVGSGVSFDKQPVRVPTGVTAAETATEVGVTIDNPFLSTKDEVFTAGLRAVRAYNGSAMSISGTVIAINQLGNSGELVLKTYSEVATAYSGKTYNQVKTLNTGQTYLQEHNNLNSNQDSVFENQVFGNANGARIWDKSTSRWYRIRQATLNPDTIQIDAEDDLTHADVKTFRGTTTYGAIQTSYAGLTYRNVDVVGLR